MEAEGRVWAGVSGAVLAAVCGPMLVLLLGPSLVACALVLLCSASSAVLALLLSAAAHSSSSSSSRSSSSRVVLFALLVVCLFVGLVCADVGALASWCAHEEQLEDELERWRCVPWSALVRSCVCLCTALLAWWWRSREGAERAESRHWGIKRTAGLARAAKAAVQEGLHAAVRGLLLGSVLAVLLAAAAGLPMAPWNGEEHAWSDVWSVVAAALAAGLAAHWTLRSAQEASITPLSARVVLERTAMALSAGNELPVWIVEALLTHSELCWRVLCAPVPLHLQAGRKLLWQRLPWSLLLPRLLEKVAGATNAHMAVRTLVQCLLLAPSLDVHGVLVRNDTFPKTLSALLHRYARLSNARVTPAAYVGLSGQSQQQLLARPGREYQGLLPAITAKADSDAKCDALLAQECRHGIYALLASPELRSLAAGGGVVTVEKDVLQRFLDGKE